MEITKDLTAENYETKKLLEDVIEENSKIKAEISLKYEHEINKIRLKYEENMKSLHDKFSLNLQREETRADNPKREYEIEKNDHIIPKKQKPNNKDIGIKRKQNNIEEFLFGEKPKKHHKN